jgi:hypothetical protein
MHHTFMWRKGERTSVWRARWQRRRREWENAYLYFFQDTRRVEGRKLCRTRALHNSVRPRPSSATWTWYTISKHMKSTYWRKLCKTRVLHNSVRPRPSSATWMWYTTWRTEGGDRRGGGWMGAESNSFLRTDLCPKFNPQSQNNARRWWTHQPIV